MGVLFVFLRDYVQVPNYAQRGMTSSARDGRTIKLGKQWEYGLHVIFRDRFSCGSARDGHSRRPLDTGVRRGPSRYLVTGGWCFLPDPWG
jgi:hypothetical protein